MRARSLLLLLLFALFASAQTPVDIDAEPHHHRLLENDQVRVFALTLRPTEQAYAMHEHNLLVIALRDCELVMWSEGHSDVQNFPFAQGDARFLFGGRAIGVRNDRSSECQQIVVEFLNPKVTTFGYQYGKGRWDYGISALSTPDPRNVPVDPHARFTNAMQLGEAVAKDVQLPPGETLPAPEKESAQLLIALSDLDLKRAGEERIRKSPADLAWIPANRRTKLTNQDAHPARFVVIELR